MKKVAIIGAGIVGSTAAYYLSKDESLDVTVYDWGQGQATKAAAGIISPWFSKRRNKAWYRMARLGADFYQTLVQDLKKDQIDTSFYQQTGVLLLKKREELLEDLYELAETRKEESPLIGDLAILSKEEIQDLFPGLTGMDRALYASGGAHVEGALLVETLLAASGARLIREQVSIQAQDKGYEIAGETYDQVILAVGAWLPQILEPLGYQVAVRPQKGQLSDFQLDLETKDYPVVMPEGEIDLIPFAGGKLSVGASHENDQGYDLTEDPQVLDQLKTDGLNFYPGLDQAGLLGHRVGIRAYTPDFSPFFGQLADQSIYLASGLGSSGLTTGPLIGYHLAQMLLGQTGPLDPADYPVENYVKRAEA